VPASNRQVLLDSSATYIEAKRVFTNAILAAQRDGMDDAEIARFTGFSVPMIVAALRTP
jgi:hypothetical protein